MGLTTKHHEFLASLGSGEDDETLRKASENGPLEMIKYLVESKVDINTIGDETLTRTAREGFIEVVKLLSDAGIYNPEEVVKLLSAAGVYDIPEK